MSIRTQETPDWMQELAADAQQMQAVISRIDELAAKGLFSLTRHDYVATGLRLGEIQEGLQLLCKLCEIKMEPHFFKP